VWYAPYQAHGDSKGVTLKQPKLSVASADYIKQFMAFGAAFGLPPSVAKVLGYLLICEPARQTAEQVQTALNLSVGAVSAALTMLSQGTLANRIKIPGDRHIYYELEPLGWQRAFEKRMATLEYGQQIAEAGLVLNKDNPRLIAMRDMYAYFTAEFAHMFKQLKNDL
jgi:DNA-binding transcriptional regulator GbsR (MarR family)